MRIGDINKDNYMDYIKLFGGTNSKALDEMWGKDKKKNSIDKSSAQSDSIADGMDITGRSDWKKIVPVSDDIKTKILNIVKNSYLNNNGITDGEEYRSVANKYIMSVPASQRASVAWTLDQISIDEGRRISAYIKENNPNWQHGKPFDYSILDNYVSGGIDTKA